MTAATSHAACPNGGYFDSHGDYNCNPSSYGGIGAGPSQVLPEGTSPTQGIFVNPESSKGNPVGGGTIVGGWVKDPAGFTGGSLSETDTPIVYARKMATLLSCREAANKAEANAIKMLEGKSDEEARKLAPLIRQMYDDALKPCSSL